MGFFGGLIFGPGIFLGFDGSAGDYFRFWFLPPLNHPCHMKAGVPYLGKILTCFWGFMVIFPYWMDLREIKMESWKICNFVSDASARCKNLFKHIECGLYIYWGGGGGWLGNIDGFFFLGGGKMRKRRDCYISSLQILNLHICFHLCICNI